MASLVPAASYAVGGAAYALLCQAATNAGVSAFPLPVLPMYVASVLRVAGARRSFGAILWNMQVFHVAISLIDLVLVGAAAIGLSYIGSGLSVVICSSSVVITPLVGSLFMGQPLAGVGQWVGVALVFAGLAYSGVGGGGGGDGGDSSSSSSDFLVGVAFCALSAVMSSVESIAIEAKNKQKQPAGAITGEELPIAMGAVCTVVIAVYMGFAVWPRWRELVVGPAVLAGTSVSHAAVLYAGMTACCFLNLSGFFALLASPGGSVLSGLMLGVRAVIVFVMSSVLFCAVQPSQCIDGTKTVAIGLIVVGLLLFQVTGDGADGQEKKGKQEEKEKKTK